MVGEKANSFHLVKHWVVTAVYLVPSVNVSGHQEGVQTRPHQLLLVRGRVSTKHRFPDIVVFLSNCCVTKCTVGYERGHSPVQVIIISMFPAGVIRWDQQTVNFKSINT